MRGFVGRRRDLTASRDPPRQTVNQVCRRLESAGELVRGPGDSGKLLNVPVWGSVRLKGHARGSRHRDQTLCYVHAVTYTPPAQWSSSMVRARTCQSSPSVWPIKDRRRLLRSTSWLTTRSNLHGWQSRCQESTDSSSASAMRQLSGICAESHGRDV